MVISIYEYICIRGNLLLELLGYMVYFRIDSNR